MKRIAVICAYPRARNLGMYSVDGAAFEFIKNLGFETKIEFFNIEKNKTILDSEKNKWIQYDLLVDPVKQLKNHDLIFFWGDFLHSQNYLEQIAKHILKSNEISTLEDARNIVYRCLLFENLPVSLLKKTLAIGGTIYVNSFLHNTSRYQNALKRLYDNALLISHREPISSLTTNIYSSKKNISLGIDNAFFLKLIKPAENDNESKIGFSFGRGVSSKYLYKYLSNSFVRKIAKSTGHSKIINIEWLKNSNDTVYNELWSKINDIKSCDYIITDTYHCAVTAIREGIPVCILGKGISIARNSTDEKKKEILLMMLQAQELYVFVEELILPRKMNKKVAEISRILKDKKNNQKLTDIVEKYKVNHISNIKKIIYSETSLNNNKK